MNWEYLKIFADVCKDLNISKAAKRLSKSHSAISQTITILEDQLQKELIELSLKVVYGGIFEKNLVVYSYQS